MNRGSKPPAGSPASVEPSAIDVSPLTRAEREVVDLALTGRSVREISEQLVVSESTVHTHLTHVYRKLGIRGRLDLLALAVRSSEALDSSAKMTDQASKEPASRFGMAFGTVLAVTLTLLGLVVPVSTLSQDLDLSQAASPPAASTPWAPGEPPCRFSWAVCFALCWRRARS